MPSKVQIQELTDHGDARGFSFSVPAEALDFLGRVKDLHVAEIRPSAVRGNHCHRRKREAILIRYETDWSFHWDEDGHSAAQHRQFTGAGAVLVLIEPGASHAVRNDGNGRLVLAALSSEAYNPHETLARKVV